MHTTTAAETMTATRKPSWATRSHDHDRSISWEHTLLEDSYDNAIPGVDLECSDRIDVEGDVVRIERSDAQIVLGDTHITIETARNVRDALTEALRLLEA